VKSLVVSLHDVSPSTFARCERIVSELVALGVKKLSLLVIPNHHGRCHVRESAEVCDWLRQCEAEGHEIVTHGYFHRRARRDGESLGEQLTTRIYTADEGEFFDLDHTAAQQLVQRGNSELEALGLSPCGFIAPAWLLSAQAEEALVELGCEYTTRLRAVHDLRTREAHDSQSLCWSVRAAWRRAVSIIWNAALYRRLEAAPLMRVAVHPVDIEHAKVWAQIRRLIADALCTREPVTYSDWIRARRQSPAVPPDPNES
jgi:predicted deacetylase